MSEVSPDAVTAAEKALDGWQWAHHKGKQRRDLVRTMLEAAATHIAQSEREYLAGLLKRAAAGRREYAEHARDDASMRRLKLSAACYESAARLITEPTHMLDVIPSWQWTEEEVAALIDGEL